MPAYRTPVRYKGSRCGLCSYCGCSRVRQFCAYPACYIYSRWRRPRAPLWSPLRAFNIRAVSFCSPLFRFVFLYSVSPWRLALPASRFASRLCVSSCVPFMRLARRLVIASRFRCLSWDAIRLSYGRRFALLAACRLVLRLVLGVCVSVLYAALACRSSFLSCVSFPRSRHAVSCSMPFLVFCSAFPLCVLPLRVAFAACLAGGVFIRHRFDMLAARSAIPCPRLAFLFSSCLACRHAFLFGVSLCHHASRLVVSFCVPFIVSLIRLVFCLPIGGVFHLAPFRFARRSFCRAVPCRAVPDDLDEPDEKRDETA